MKKNNRVLLDTSAIIALLKKEAGHKIVENVLAISAVSSVNFSELVATLSGEGIQSNDIDQITQNIVPEMISFDRELAIIAGKLISKTKPLGLSLGDRACIATALYCELPIYTSDKAWTKLDIPNLTINVIR